VLRTLLVGWTARGAGLALGVGLVVVIATLATRAGGVLLLAFLAVLLAAGLEPFIGWLRSHVPIPRAATILLVYLVFFAAVAVLVLLVLPAAYVQADRVVRRLPGLLTQVHTWAATLQPEGFSTAMTKLVEGAQDALKPGRPPDPDQVVQAGVTVIEAVASVGTLLALVFFWLLEHARLQRFGLAFLPLERRGGARDAWNQIETRLGMWVRGQLLLMASVGLATGTAYWALGVPAWLVLAVIAAIMEGIPIIGPALGAVPAVLAAATVSPQLALVVAGVAVVIQLVENNVLVPVIMRNTIGLSPLVVTVTLLVGGAVGGIVGALIAVPVAAAIEVVLERLQDRSVPVAQDPAAIERAEADHVDDDTTRLPDSGRPRRRRRTAAAGGGTS
jgi:predicted PurR-regulated permease PerM